MKKTFITAALLSLTCALASFAAEGGQAQIAQSQDSELFEQGNGFLQSGKHEEAKKAFTGAIALNPNYAEAHVGLGKVLMLQLNYEEAAKEFARAIDLTHDDYTAYFNQGVAYYHFVEVLPTQSFLRFWGLDEQYFHRSPLPSREK